MGHVSAIRSMAAASPDYTGPPPLFLRSGLQQQAQLDGRKPNAVRVYDCILGGKDNFKADRRAADKVASVVPDVATAAIGNREFLARAVNFLAGEAGIAQLIDIGSGLPVLQKVPVLRNTDELAQQVNASARVAYVDCDPVALLHMRECYALHDPNVIAVLGDLREPRDVLASEAVQEFIDLRQPFAVILGAVLHYLPAREAYAAVTHLKDVMPPGSYLVISHGTRDAARDGEAEAVTKIYEQMSSPLFPRTLAEVTRFFDGLDIIPPGVSNVSRWRTNLTMKAPGRILYYGGTGRKALGLPRPRILSRSRHDRRPR